MVHHGKRTDGGIMLTNVIPSFVYAQFQDDDSVQAFVQAQNENTQAYIDLLNALNLPIYTSPPVSGPVLDWVAEGLYGMSRPTLSSGTIVAIGPLNTYACNVLACNQVEYLQSGVFYATNDDVFRRIITWHFSKADGKVFNTRWLKRRVVQFLNGANGILFNVDDTSQVSVTFGTGRQVNISILAGIRTVTGGAYCNGFACNTQAPNEFESTYVAFPPVVMAPIFAAAVAAGALELPFTGNYVVTY
jgi:hypothetical protein